jgi:heme/copper-type cytochrome/quinol oxidase subunit 2
VPLGLLLWVPAASAESRSFEVTASKYKFEPEVLTVDQGDDVTITLKSSDRSHGFEIKEYNVKTEIPEGGGTVKVQFVADKPGTFTFRCSKFCGLGHGKMKGRLIVTPKVQ